MTVVIVKVVIVTVATVVIVTLVTVVIVPVVTVVIVTYFSKINLTPQQLMKCSWGSVFKSCDVFP